VCNQTSIMYDTLIHISDIHIRKGHNRYNEYNTVFQNLHSFLQKLKSIKECRALIVVTGDVFHDKGAIDSFGIKLFAKLVQGCAKLAPIIIIAGNHDIKQESSREDSPDILDVLLGIHDNPNVFYIKETGLYEFENIGFGVQVIQDVLEKGNTTGLNQNIEPFPSHSKFSTNVNYKIALCHIAIDEVCGSFRNRDIISHKHFEGYNYTLLGDVHKRQSACTDTMTWGYSGSLIQQNFGESLQHGGYIWEMGKQLPTIFNIDNPCSYITLAVRNNEVYIYNDRRLMLFSDFVSNMTSINLCIKTKGNFDIEYKNRVKQVCEINNKTVVSLIETIDDVDTFSKQDKDLQESMDNFNNEDAWMTYLTENMPEKHIEPSISFIKNSSSFLPKLEDMRDHISQSKLDWLKSKIEFLSGLRNNTQEQILNSKKELIIESLKWDWIFSFGSGNSFDFMNMKKKIVLLNGRNASGKSNFVEVLLIAMFGTGVPSRSNYHYSAKSTIHHSKPVKDTAQTVITFWLGSDKYILTRKFKASKVSMVVDTLLESDVLQVCLKQGAVKNWIKDNIGAIQDLLVSCFITQGNDSDFFSLKEGERGSLLEKALNMDSIGIMANTIRDYQSVYKNILCILETLYEEYENEKTTMAITSSEEIVIHTDIIENKQCEYEKCLGELEELRCNFLANDVLKLENFVIEGHESNTNEEELLKRKLEIETELVKFPQISTKPITKYVDIPQKPTISFEHYIELSKRFKNYKGTSQCRLEDEGQSTEGLESELVSLDSKINDLLQNRPLACKETEISLEKLENKVKSVCNNLAEWQQYLGKQDDIEMAEGFMKEIHHLEQTLDKQDKLAFNPECWACCQNPVHIMVKGMEDKIEMLKMKIKMTIPDTSLIAKYPQFKVWEKEYRKVCTQEDYIEEQKQLLRENNSWIKQYNDAKKRYGYIKEHLDAEQYSKYVVNTQSINDWVSYNTSLLDSIKEQIEYARLYASKPYFDKYQAKKTNVSELQKKLDNDKKTLVIMKEKYNRSCLISEKMDILKCHITNYKNVFEMLVSLSQYFEGDKTTLGLKEWLQREKVVPFLMNRINPIVKHYGLEMDVIFDNQRYDFFIKDVGNDMKVIYGRASGFQKFIVGVAMRVALSRMGASKVVPYQMFIDEGFSSCDTLNLSKMPEMVRYFLKYFESIVLISHLDTIKGCADMNIEIVKTDDKSFIDV